MLLNVIYYRHKQKQANRRYNMAYQYKYKINLANLRYIRQTNRYTESNPNNKVGTTSNNKGYLAFLLGIEKGTHYRDEKGRWAKV